MTQEAQTSLVHELIESGIHFGQRASNWNPKMARYIYGKKNGVHVIDVRETIKGLLLAKRLIKSVVEGGKDVCFIGTKRQAKDSLQSRVGDVGMHWVTERWLGGTLTNFRTIRSRLKRLEELEAIEKNDNFASYSKKMESQLRREMEKIKRNLEGIRHMVRLPGAMVVIDVRKEVTALREARKLGIPTICLIDTDGDTELADIAIPGNDDSIRAIDLVLRELCKAVADGKQNRQSAPPTEEEPADEPKPDRRRSRRTQYRSDGRGDSGGEGESRGGRTDTRTDARADSSATRASVEQPAS